MHLKKSSLALSMLFAITPIAYAATNLSDYNYNPNVSSKETGVDFELLINCGYDYADVNCDSSSPAVKQGYRDSTNINVGTNAGRDANKDTSIYDSNKTNSLGINSIEDHSLKYSDTRDVNKQKGTAQGLAFKNQCLQYSDEQLSVMANSTNATEKALGNDCLVVRTVAITNDKAISGSVISETDPLYETVKKRNVKNTQTSAAVASVTNTSDSASKANSQAYSCELEPTRTEYSSTLCNAKGMGRQQLCTQNLVIKCGQDVVGDRELAECISGMDRGTVKLVSASNGRIGSFIGNDSQIYLNERWHDGNSASSGKWVVTFLVKNPAKVNMALQSYYFDNKLEFSLNGTFVSGADDRNSDGTRVLNLPLNKYLVIGQNTLVVDMYNYHGPAAANFKIAIGESSYQGCSCVESWETTCNISKVEL